MKKEELVKLVYRKKTIDKYQNKIEKLGINNKYDIFEEYEDYKNEIKMKFNNSDSKYYYYLPLFKVIMINGFSSQRPRDTSFEREYASER